MSLKTFAEKHASLFQLIKFLTLSLIASVVEFLVFALCNYVLFKGYSARNISWFIFNYTAENGGLCAFLSMAISYAAAQITNFLVQRKYTFKATNNVALSALLYTIMVLLTYAFVMYLPSLIGAPVYRALGATAGAVVVKIICQSSSALIQFPLNKFVVMKA